LLFYVTGTLTAAYIPTVIYFYIFAVKYSSSIHGHRVVTGERWGLPLYLSFDIFIAIGRFSAEELLI